MAKKKNGSKKNFSRRNFLKVSGLAVGAAGMGLLTGCGGDSDTNVTVYGGSGSGGTGGGTQLPVWDDIADIVLLGYGGASAMAAIHAYGEDPSLKMLILEWQGRGGGSTVASGGGTYLGGGTAVQVENGFNETADLLYKYAVAAVGEGGDPALLRKYADNAKATYDALAGFGLVYTGMIRKYYGYSSAPQDSSLLWDGEGRPELLEAARLVEPVGEVPVMRRSHWPIPEEGLNRAQTLWKAIDAKINSIVSSGGDIRINYNTRAQSLIVYEDRVVGVSATAEDGSTKYYKAAKAVFVGTGGFILNDDMVAQHLPHALECVRGGTAGDMGDGIKMGQAIGADLRGMSNAEDYGCPYNVHPAAVKGIAVTDKGIRFAPEDISGPRMGRLIARTYPLTYIIVDSQIKAEIDDSDWNRLRTESGATVAELEDKLNMPAGSLQSTVDQYNATAVAGYDALQKDPEVVQPLNTGPYYAVYRTRSQIFTLTTGGLRINPETQVLDTEGKVIPGLYAAGSAAATILAQHYIGPGGGTAGAFVFGRIAGLEMPKETAWE